MSGIAHNIIKGISNVFNSTGAMLTSDKVENIEDPSQVVKGRCLAPVEEYPLPVGACLSPVEEVEKNKPKVNKAKTNAIKKLYGF